MDLSIRNLKYNAWYLLLFLTVLLLPAPGRAAGAEDSTLEAPSWVFSIPANLVRDKSPLRLEITPIPQESPYSSKRVAVAYPYVDDPATGQKMYFAPTTAGDFRPVSGVALINAKLNRQLLKFDIWVLTQGLSQAVREIDDVAVSGVTASPPPPDAKDYVLQGRFRNLDFHIRMQTYDGDRLIEGGSQRWAKGQIVDTGAEYWALIAQPTRLGPAPPKPVAITPPSGRITVQGGGRGPGRRRGPGPGCSPSDRPGFSGGAVPGQGRKQRNAT